MKNFFRVFSLIFMFSILSSVLCFGGSSELIGAGATFPYPLYSKMFNEYHEEFKVKVNYQAIGSGGGIRQLKSKTVDFGGTDAFMSDEDVALEDNQILHIPICLGAVVVTYNLPGKPELKLDSEVIAGIFLGEIKKWNDPKLKRLNPDINLPNQKILVVHRSDGSGTTFIFSDYLSKVSSAWKDKVGRGKSLNWPVGVGAKGNSGVAGVVQQMPFSIGYVELIYATNTNMTFAKVKNSSGNFINPSVNSVTQAAGIELPDHTRVSLTNTDAENGYPLSSFTWLILYKEQSYGNRSKPKAETLLKLIWWMTHDGQKFAEPLHYAPLPEKAVEKAEAILKSVTFNNHRVLNK